MESKTGLKAPEKLCIIGFLLHFFSNFEIWILFADAIVYFQVVLYVRELPPYGLVLKISPCDTPWPQQPCITYITYITNITNTTNRTYITYISYITTIDSILLK